MANIYPDKDDLYYDPEAKDLFEYVCPDLAASVYKYIAMGPNSIHFVTGTGHHFYWYIVGPKTANPMDLRWTLECVYFEKDMRWEVDG